MNGIVKLRTMTFKSVIGFGGWTKCFTVQDLINTEHSDELVKMYYKLGNITFTEEVLNAIGITSEWRIEKPGKCYDTIKAFWVYCKTKNKAELGERKLMNMLSHKRKVIRINKEQNYRHETIKDSFYNSKGSMAAKNQNRKKF